MVGERLREARTGAGLPRVDVAAGRAGAVEEQALPGDRERTVLGIGRRGGELDRLAHGVRRGLRLDEVDLWCVVVRKDLHRGHLGGPQVVGDGEGRGVGARARVDVAHRRAVGRVAVTEGPGVGQPVAIKVVGPRPVERDRARLGVDRGVDDRRGRSVAGGVAQPLHDAGLDVGEVQVAVGSGPDVHGRADPGAEARLLRRHEHPPLVVEPERPHHLPGVVGVEVGVPVVLGIAVAGVPGAAGDRRLPLVRVRVGDDRRHHRLRSRVERRAHRRRRVSGDLRRALETGPAVVAAGQDPVDLLVVVPPDVAGEQAPGRRVEGEAERVAQAVGIGAAAPRRRCGRVEERVVRPAGSRHRVDAQDLAVGLVQVLRAQRSGVGKRVVELASPIPTSSAPSGATSTVPIP